MKFSCYLNTKQPSVNWIRVLKKNIIFPRCDTDVGTCQRNWIQNDNQIQEFQPHSSVYAVLLFKQQRSLVDLYKFIIVLQWRSQPVSEWGSKLENKQVRKNELNTFETFKIRLYTVWTWNPTGKACDLS